jgi:glycosyltransferase involved in cell wall biosynthesis
MISLVVPVYNEQETISLFHQAIKNNADLAAETIEIIFVNDGSKDNTLSEINTLLSQYPNIVLVDLSRNFGKEAALLAGLHHASGEAVIPMDVDLQDPVEVIPQLIAKWREGYDVVLAKRIDRSSDSRLKYKTASWFYALHNKISHPAIEEHAGDFRLMSRKVIEALKSLPENQLFMKGLLSWVGFNTALVEYTRPKRIAGETKFNGWKLWNLALEGITGFSTVPLRIWSYLGGLISIFSFIFATYLIIDKIFFGNPVSGYPSIMVVILFLGGVQLIGIGVLGEYIGRIYMESKKRPTYIVNQIKKS